MFLFALFFFQLLGTIGAMEEIVMGKIVLYLAISVDGYLVDEQGGADLTCRFCDSVQHFSREDLEAMVREIQKKTQKI